MAVLPRVFYPALCKGTVNGDGVATPFANVFSQTLGKTDGEGDGVATCLPSVILHTLGKSFLCRVP